MDQVRGLVARVLYRDARKMLAAGKGDFFSSEEMDAFLAMPDLAFPLVQRGVTFKNRAELQVARNASKCKKEISASLQASMDRIEAFAKGRIVADNDVPTINVQQMYVAIPQPPVSGELAPKADNVLVLRRSAKDIERKMIDAVVAK